MKHFEPVVKKSASYSILFLKDDSKVVRLRLKPFWIKTLALVFLLFSVASGAAGYAAHYYWKKYQTIQLERTELVAQLGEKRRQLGRFVGMEKIKESTMPRSTMAGVTTIAGQDGANGAGAENPQNGAATASPGQPADTAATPSTLGSEQAGASQAPSSPGEGTAAAPQAAGPTDAATPSDGGQATPESGVKEHPALISEVQIRPSGNKTFRLSFDLSNRDQQVRLNGRIQVAVSTKSGGKLEITQINKDSLRFIINNYKRVSTEFVLPGDIKTEDIARVHLTVTAEEQPDITYSFPIPTTF